MVAGYAIRHPVGGNLIACLHHILGLARLGHEVVYVEDAGWPFSCYDPLKGEYNDDPSYGIRAVRQLLTAHGAEVPICYLASNDVGTLGLDRTSLLRALREADLLLNVGGVCWISEFESTRRRALIDKDPFFTQVGLFGGSVADRHHIHFSYGVNIGRQGCSIPDAGIRWHPTVPPVVLDLWVPENGNVDAPFTTIGSLKPIATVTYNGEEYGQKDVEFAKFMELPRRTSQRLELALKDSREMMDRMASAGWSVRSAAQVSTAPEAYRRYICGSRGEFSVAQNGYVKTWSGWFSDRSVCYLAAGRPVVIQDTGFSDWLPTGCGVVSFKTVDEAVEGLSKVNAEYAAHSAAAREIAMTTFDAGVVLARLLDVALGYCA